MIHRYKSYADVLFSLLRYSLNGEKPVSLPKNVEWTELLNLASIHGVLSFVIDAIHTLIEDGAFPDEWNNVSYPGFDEVKYESIGSFISSESEYKSYKSSLDSFLSLIREGGFKVILLKGYGLSLDYPVPYYRPCGDIDIFVIDGGTPQELDKYLNEKLGCVITKSKNSHHSHMQYCGYSVENHYELSNLYSATQKNKYLENQLQRLARENPVPCDNFYLPSPTFNAVFLVWHMYSHFTGEKLNLRQICDWMMFLKKHSGQVDWETVDEILGNYGLRDFSRYISFAVYRYLSDEKVCPLSFAGYDPLIPDRIIEDSLFGKLRSRSLLLNAFRYVRSAWKFRLVQGNSWVKSMAFSIKLHYFQPDDMTETVIYQ